MTVLDDCVFVTTLVEGRRAGVVSAVAQDHEGLPRMPATIGVGESRVDRVEQRRPALRLDDLCQRGSKHGRVARERLSGRKGRPSFVVEGDRKQIVTGMARRRKRGRAGDQLVGDRPHADTAVDDQSDGDWSVLVGEQGDGLGSSVFIDGKRSFCQAADVLPVSVSHSDVQHDEVGRCRELRRGVRCLTASARMRPRGVRSG